MAGIYIENKSCARDNMSCVRDNKSCDEKLSRAHDIIFEKKTLCPKYTTVLFKLSSHELYGYLNNRAELSLTQDKNLFIPKSVTEQ